MSLIACSECGAEISQLAESCPQCGRPSEATVQKREKASAISSKHVASGFMILVIGVLLFFAVSPLMGGIVAAIGLLEALYGQAVKAK